MSGAPWNRWLLAAGAAFAVVAVAEVALRAAGYKGPAADPYESFVLHRPLFERDGDSWRTAPGRRRFFHDQTFAAAKPAGLTRFFVVGGSVAYGYGLPAPREGSFVAGLARRLAGAGPAGRAVEAINVGGIGYASYRLVGVVEECLGHGPDFVVVMAGHNEFLEPRHYGDWMAGGRSAPARWARLRLAQWAGELAERRRAWRAGPAVAERRPALASDEIEERYIVRDADEVARTLAHYAANLERVARACRRAGVPLVLCTSPSNLRDFPPFVTAPTFAAPAALLSNQLARATVLVATGDHVGALTVAEDVTALEPNAAVFHYLAGVCLDRLGRKADAKDRYVLARDRDGFPHRAPSAFNDAARRVAKERGVALFDAERLFERRSPDGIPGANLFIDQCHPNAAGHELLAEGLREVLAPRGVAGNSGAE